MRMPPGYSVSRRNTAVSSGIWYCGVFSDAEVGAGVIATIRQEFAVALEAAGEPPGACLFVIEAEGDTTASIFFSPSAVSAVREVIARCNAQPSAPPERARATLLVGRPADWDLLPRSAH